MSNEYSEFDPQFASTAYLDVMPSKVEQANAYKKQRTIARDVYGRIFHSVPENNLIEVLHTVANEVNVGSDWDNDYKRGASQILINGIEPFPEGSAITPNVNEFKSKLRKEFNDKQKITLLPTAVNQLTQLSCVDGLALYFAKANLKLFEQEHVYMIDSERGKINVVPNNIPGVVDIILHIGLKSLNETQVTFVIALKGFYDISKQKFIFPVYSSGLGFRSQHITAAINIADTSQEKDIAAKNSLENILWTDHYRDNPKWHLEPRLAQLYKNSVQRKHDFTTVLSDPKTKIWEYFSMGTGHKISKRTKQDEDFFTKLTANFLIIGENLIGKDEFRKQAINLQMQHAYPKPAVADVIPFQGGVATDDKIAQVVMDCINTLKLDFNYELEDDRKLLDDIIQQARDIDSQTKSGDGTLKKITLEQTLWEQVASAKTIFYCLAKAGYDAGNFEEFWVELGRYDKPYDVVKSFHDTKKNDDVNFLLKKTMWLRYLMFFCKQYYPQSFTDEGLMKQKTRRFFSTADETKLIELAKYIFEHMNDMSSEEKIKSKVSKTILKKTENTNVLRDVFELAPYTQTENIPYSKAMTKGVCLVPSTQRMALSKAFNQLESEANNPKGIFARRFSKSSVFTCRDKNAKISGGDSES